MFVLLWMFKDISIPVTRTLKENHVRCFKGGDDVTLGLLQLLLVEVCSAMKTEARCISQVRKLHATITGVKTQRSPSGPDTDTRLDASNAYRAGSVRHRAGRACKRLRTHVSFAFQTSQFTENYGSHMI